MKRVCFCLLTAFVVSCGQPSQSESELDEYYTTGKLQAQVDKAVDQWLDVTAKKSNRPRIQGIVSTQQEICKFVKRAPNCFTWGAAYVPGTWVRFRPGAPYSIILHEVGHALGLWHYEGQANVMYPVDKGLTVLTALDIQRIRRVWGAPNSADVPGSQEKKSCTGVYTDYPHGTVTTYQGNTYTCNNGGWIFSSGT